MKITTGNTYDNTEQSVNLTYRLNGGGSLLGRRGRMRGRERLREEQNEQKIRENENKMIEELKKRIALVHNAEGMDSEIKSMKIQSLTEQIQLIFEQRAKREAEAAKREAERIQADMEKERLEREKKYKEKAENNPNVNEDEAMLREDINGLVKASVSMGSLTQFKRDRTLMASEAGQLKRDIDNSFGFMQYGLDVTVKVKTGYEKPGDFRNRQLARLEKGIAGLDSAINREIVKMYNTSKTWTENKIDIVSDPAEDYETPDEEDGVKPAVNAPEGADGDRESAPEQND